MVAHSATSYRLYKALYSIIIGLTLTCFGSTSFAEQVTAAIDKSVVSENEIVQLTVRTDFSDTGNGPDFSVLKRDFEILSRSQNSQFSFNLGTNQALNFWVVTLMPKAVGHFEIPPIQVGDKASEPIFLEVKPAQQMTDANGNPLIMVKFSSDTLEPYVQQQVLLTLELYTATTLQNAKLSAPNHSNLLIERLSDDQMRYEEINGTSYQVLTREYVAFPQSSGAIELTNQSVQAVINTRTGRRMANIKSAPITLNVLPIPASYGNSNWLPTDAVAVKSNISTTLTNPKVGDTLMWNIDITAQGVLGEQLPTLNFASTRAYKLYPTSPSFDTSKNIAGVMGRESISIEVVPTEAGELQLPPVEVFYWDPRERVRKTITASAKPVTIAPLVSADGLQGNTQTPTPAIDDAGEISAPDALPPQAQSVAPISLAKAKPTKPEKEQNNEPEPIEVVIETNDSDSSISWKTLIASSLIGIGLLGAFVWLILSRKRQTRVEQVEVPTLQEFAPLSSHDETSAYVQLIEGCRAHNLSTLRINLLEWARHRWGDETIRGVEDIKRLTNTPRLTQLLMEAELVMYSETASSSWHGDALADAIEEYVTGHEKPSQASQLKTLYPNF